MTQACRIIKKFGGAEALAEALSNVGLERSKHNVYRWTYPREKGGTGGVIPTPSLPHVLLAARNEGILITREDLDPRPQSEGVNA
jgi:hypothetical protein